MLMVQHKAPHRPWEPAAAQAGRSRGREDSRAGDAVRRLREPRHGRPEGRDADQPDESAERRQAVGRTTQPASAVSVQPHERRRSGRRGRSTSIRGWRSFSAANPQGRRSHAVVLSTLHAGLSACVESVDDSVGKLLEYLDESGLAKNTIVVYTSDQGFYLGEHGWFDKRFMYEESLRTPLVVRWPGVVKPGSVEEQIVSNVDFAPTFLEAAGVEVPEEMQGRSFMPRAARRSAGGLAEVVLLSLLRRQRTRAQVAKHEGVTTGSAKLINFYPIERMGVVRSGERSARVGERVWASRSMRRRKRNCMRSWSDCAKSLRCRRWSHSSFLTQRR